MNNDRFFSKPKREPVAGQSITDAQLDILRHATGWPKSYRNHFVSGEGCSTFEDCRALEKAGFMVSRPFPLDGTGDSTLFTVTDEGLSHLRAHAPC